MVTSFMSVAIMLTLDIYVYLQLKDKTFAEFSDVEAVIIVIGRFIQYHSVNLFIYYILYWPYRRNL